MKALLLLPCLLGFADPDGNEMRRLPPRRPGPVKGVVSGGRALALLHEDKGAKVYLCSTPLAGGKGEMGPCCAWAEVPPLRWSVGHGHAWIFNNYTVPPGAFGYGVQDRLQRYLLDDLIKGRPVSAPDASPEEVTLYFFLVGGPLLEIRLMMGWVEFESEMHTDYLPLGPDSVRVFRLTNVRGRLIPAGKDGGLEAVRIHFEKGEDKIPGWSFRTYDFKGEWLDKKKNWGDGKWTEGEEIAVGFKEPFQVAALGDDYYFVTESGKVFRSPKSEKGKGRKTEPVWDDDKRPVIAFIQDADAGKSFVFCKADKEGKGVYFELAAKPDPCPYDGKDIKPARPHDPLPAVLGYAKVLVADKKVKEK
jgi:hypothetical protein